jgi:hypothetical protein
MPQRNASTGLDTPVIGGEAGRARLSTSEDREPERVSTVQPGSRVPRREPMAGRWRCARRATRAAASRINGLSCRRRCRREGERRQARVGMNYGGSVSQRQENVGRYILRNIPILWVAPAPSDEPSHVFCLPSERERELVARAVVVNGYHR